MFEKLMESAPTRQSFGGRLAGSTLSLAVHTGFIFGAVLGTMKAEGVVQSFLPDDEMVFLITPPEDEKPKPTTLTQPAPRLTHTIVAPVRVPTGIPPINLAEEFDVRELSSYTIVEGDMLGIEEDNSTSMVRVFSVATVDETPVRISSPPLEYPRLMQRAGVEGMVLVQAVVDTNGRVERESIEVIRSDNAAFNGAARRLVERSVFSPGRVSGRPVRVLIQIPVQFSLIGIRS